MAHRGAVARSAAGHGPPDDRTRKVGLLPRRRVCGIYPIGEAGLDETPKPGGRSRGVGPVAVLPPAGVHLNHGQAHVRADQDAGVRRRSSCPRRSRGALCDRWRARTLSLIAVVGLAPRPPPGRALGTRSVIASPSGQVGQRNAVAPALPLGGLPTSPCHRAFLASIYRRRAQTRDFGREAIATPGHRISRRSTARSPRMCGVARARCRGRLAHSAQPVAGLPAWPRAAPMGCHARP